VASELLDTGSDKVLLRVEDGVAVVTLNDPENRNPIGGEVRPVLRRTLDRVAADRALRCLVLTGAGQAFSAGGNTKAMASGRQPGLAERIRQIKWESAASAVIHEMDKPSIAALPGPAAGAGFSLALACDLRIAAQSAFMTTSFLRIGLSGDYGGTWFLTRLVGPAKARELYYTSARVSADECLRLGMVNRVVPDAELQGEALALARELAGAAPLALRYMKENLNRALRADLRSCIDAEGERQCQLAETEDFLEAARAFVERRKPVFKGR
jgi:2-(1,2-epoxy-1,2-dihydrophenyl)acetyl-CoA isomerase